jgi:hypothetical protein
VITFLAVILPCRKLNVAIGTSRPVFSFAVAIEDATIQRDCDGEGKSQPEVW